MKKALLLLVFASLMFSACSAKDNSLVGTWNLTAYGPQDSPTSPVPGTQAFITFKEDGTLAGNSGCNGFGGEYKVDGGQITFSALISTLMACAEPIMVQEGTIFSVLDGATTYDIKGGQLTIIKNGTVLVFTAGEAQSYSYP